MTEEENISFFQKYKYYIIYGSPIFCYLFYETSRQYENNKTFLHNTTPLTRLESIIRRENIKNIKYDLFIYLENAQIPTIKKYQGYKGHILINFNILNKKTIHLDYLGDIISFKLNNTQYFPKVYKNKITIQGDNLNIGENSIEILFASRYSVFNDKVLGLSYIFDPNNV
jgi:hypothetical protein